MLNLKSILLVLMVGFVLASCSSKAGPFVTNISSDGEGNLIVEKCMLRFDRNIGVVENSDCSYVPVKLKNNIYKSSGAE